MFEISVETSFRAVHAVTVGGVESHRTQSGVGRVGTNSLGWGISCKVLTTFETSSTKYVNTHTALWFDTADG